MIEAEAVIITAIGNTQSFEVSPLPGRPALSSGLRELVYRNLQMLESEA